MEQIAAYFKTLLLNHLPLSTSYRNVSSLALASPFPDGKREGAETDFEALMREVKEELSVDLRPETIRRCGTFEIQAHGTVVRMTCYAAEFDGELRPSSEIEKIALVNYSWKDKSSPVDRLIFDDLKSKDLIS